MSAKYSRVHRLLRILYLIDRETGWTAEKLADTCDVSTRNIYRDMEMIKQAGFHCFFDRKTGGYRVDRQLFMPPVELTLDEALALMALGEQIGGKGQIPFTSAAGRALSKIRGRLPAQMQRELDELDDHLEVRLPSTAPEDGADDVYEKVRTAITSRTALLCSYESRSKSDDEETFYFEPYVLFFSQRAWYAVGFHRGRQSVRSLKLSRFTRLERTEDAYKIPARFSLDKYLGNAWRMIRGSKRYKVKIAFDAEFADNIAETNWHPTQEIDWLEDGSIHFNCEVDGLDEIVWWVLGMGPHARVIQPAELAERVADLARQVAERYAG